ncbi:type B 50S ribosomal protein L31 [Streptomyces sp. NPDC093094]|uniref:type B 50S ribosomal protein L31 n=1 Tax=Streptomyces sp. NPDC093094 TaxID=3366026 RepID=UPI003803CFC3
MKHGIHPETRQVVFRDRAAGVAFLIRSTAHSTRTIEWEDGASHPLIDVDTSSASHPFHTGTTRIVDSAGRVERFERRYGGAGTARR